MAGQMVPIGRLLVATPASMALAIRQDTEARDAVDERVAPIAADIIASDGTVITAAAAAVGTALAAEDVLTGPDPRVLQVIRAAGWSHGVVDPTTLAILLGIDDRGKTKAWLREDTLTDYGTLGDRTVKVIRDENWLWAVADPTTGAIFLGVRRTGRVYAFGLSGGGPAVVASPVLPEKATLNLGDSLTYSSGTTWPENSLPATTGMPGLSLAMFGQLSHHQALISGDLTGYLTFPSNQLSATGVTAVSAMGPTSRTWTYSSSTYDWIVPGSVITDDGTRVDGQLVFKSGGAGIEFRHPGLTTAKAIRATSPFTSAWKGRVGKRTRVIWVGRNNVTQSDTSRLAEDITMMVAGIESTEKRSLILGITGRTDEGISASGTGATRRAARLAANAASLATYGDVSTGGTYFDMHAWMRDELLTVLGMTPDSTDIADIADDRIPTRLYLPGDTTHFTAQVYAAIGVKVGQLVIQKGYTL
ncbi:MAG: hypothetical protein J0I95_04205 [Microbacterium sp.]|uniref:hypothetical protein n=1 Tax=unclassified Microbacterium TaxID=2609290 RepID=UPI001ACF1742|nr:MULTISPECIES: hypothetical protein [unclassified Microbacterium]MBN9210703.1 hypothetical protein [Microbacterium sp.]